MQRKLRRHLNALVLSTALSAVLPLTALVLERPAAAGMDGMADAAQPATEATVGQEPAPVQRRRRANSRDALSLPFFSFARTLRRGNGS